MILSAYHIYTLQVEWTEITFYVFEYFLTMGILYKPTSSHDILSERGAV